MPPVTEKRAAEVREMIGEGPSEAMTFERELARDAYELGRRDMSTVAAKLREAVGFLRSCCRSGEDGAEHPLVIGAVAAYEDSAERDRGQS